MFFSELKMTRRLNKINKANGINIALRYQAETTLAATRADLAKIIRALRFLDNDDSHYKSELIRAAKVLDKQVIPEQEKIVEQLTEMVRSGREAATKLNETLRNKRLTVATKSLISNVQHINSLPDVDSTDLNLSRETLKAYNEIQDTYKELDALDDEAYLKELLAR